MRLRWRHFEEVQQGKMSLFSTSHCHNIHNVWRYVSIQSLFFRIKSSTYMYDARPYTKWQKKVRRHTVIIWIVKQLNLVIFFFFYKYSRRMAKPWRHIFQHYLVASCLTCRCFIPISCILSHYFLLFITCLGKLAKVVIRSTFFICI